jgi:hypothetical protein
VPEVHEDVLEGFAGLWLMSICNMYGGRGECQRTAISRTPTSKSIGTPG